MVGVTRRSMLLLTRELPFEDFLPPFRVQPHGGASRRVASELAFLFPFLPGRYGQTFVRLVTTAIPIRLQ